MIEDKAPETVSAALESDPQAVYLDVRTVGEFVRGHEPGSLNDPIAEPSTATGMMVPNPDFIAVVESAIAREATIYCGCASGIRSRHAVTLLHEAGYSTAYNVTAGFNGVVDPLGRVIEPGWAARGLEIESGDGGPFSYAALRAASEPADG